MQFNRIIRVIMVIISMVSAGQAAAEEGRGNIGFGSKSLVIATTTGGVTSNFTWAGVSLTGGL